MSEKNENTRSQANSKSETEKKIENSSHVSSAESKLYDDILNPLNILDLKQAIDEKVDKSKNDQNISRDLIRDEYVSEYLQTGNKTGIPRQIPENIQLYLQELLDLDYDELESLLPENTQHNETTTTDVPQKAIKYTTPPKHITHDSKQLTIKPSKIFNDKNFDSNTKEDTDTDLDKAKKDIEDGNTKSNTVLHPQEKHEIEDIIGYPKDLIHHNQNTYFRPQSNEMLTEHELNMINQNKDLIRSDIPNLPQKKELTNDEIEQLNSLYEEIDDADKIFDRHVRYETLKKLAKKYKGISDPRYNHFDFGVEAAARIAESKVRSKFNPRRFWVEKTKDSDYLLQQMAMEANQEYSLLAAKKMKRGYYLNDKHNNLGKNFTLRKTIEKLEKSSTKSLDLAHTNRDTSYQNYFKTITDSSEINQNQINPDLLVEFENYIQTFGFKVASESINGNQPINKVFESYASEYQNKLSAFLSHLGLEKEKIHKINEELEKKTMQIIIAEQKLFSEKILRGLTKERINSALERFSSNPLHLQGGHHKAEALISLSLERRDPSTVDALNAIFTIHKARTEGRRIVQEYTSGKMTKQEAIRQARQIKQVDWRDKALLQIKNFSEKNI